MQYPSDDYDRYREAFPNATAIDDRQLSQRQLLSLDEYYRLAVERGSPLTPRDFGLEKDTWHGDLDPETTVI